MTNIFLKTYKRFLHIWHVLPERLRGVCSRRGGRYTNPRLPDLTLLFHCVFLGVLPLGFTTELQCVPKNFAKIQITITTAYIIRINYPLSSFNYRLSGSNVANFDKIHRTVSEQQLFLNKKLRYREEHSASVVLSWCTL